MNQAEFQRRFDAYHAAIAPRSPHLVGWEPVDPSELAKAEAAHGIELSKGFRAFLLSYGHGGFYFATIFSPLLESSPGGFKTIWEYARWDQFDGSYLPISSNGCELWTGYKIEAGRCSERLFNYDVDEESYTGEEYESIWDFLSEVALVRVG